MGNCCVTTSESVKDTSVRDTSVRDTSVKDTSVRDTQTDTEIAIVCSDKTETKETEKDPYQDSTYENTPEYTLNGLRTKVKILRILDGDTVDIALYHEESQRIYRHRVRLYGIDTPEKRPSLSNPNRQAEIAASLKAKQALEQRIKENDCILLALFYSPDKYGRQMCTFYDKNGEDINQWMIQQGHAYEYHGKTKKAFEPTTPRFTP
jgi:micrococcal nuclease